METVDRTVLLLYLVAMLSTLLGIGYLLYVIKYECIRKIKSFQSGEQERSISEVIPIDEGKIIKVDIKVRLIGGENKN